MIAVPGSIPRDLYLPLAQWLRSRARYRVRHRVQHNHLVPCCSRTVSLLPIVVLIRLGLLRLCEPCWRNLGVVVVGTERTGRSTQNLQRKRKTTWAHVTPPVSTQERILRFTCHCSRAGTQTLLMVKVNAAALDAAAAGNEKLNDRRRDASSRETNWIKNTYRTGPLVIPYTCSLTGG
jgi:hypothetical protein